MSKRPEVFSYQDEGDEEASRDRSRKTEVASEPKAVLLY